MSTHEPTSPKGAGDTTAPPLYVPTPGINPTSSGWAWGVRSDGHVTFRHGHAEFDEGHTADPNGPFARVFDCALRPTPLTWRTLASDHDSDHAKEAMRVDDERCELIRLTSVAEHVKLRLDPTLWRMLSPNPVLHPQFGPCLTVATDGVRVILFDFATLTPGWWVLTHRSNLIGPVTSTPVSAADWDYISNRPANTGTFAKRRGAGVKKRAKPPTLALALAALQNLINEPS